MELSIWTFLIVCPLTFLGGFVDAVAGGGGLISLPAYMIAGVPVHNAIATNKLSSGMGTTISTYRLAKLGYIPWRRAALCILMAIIGSSAGANLALMVDAELFKRIMLVIIPLTALYVMRNKKMDEKERSEFIDIVAAIKGAKAGAYKLMEKYSKITKAERKAIDKKVDAFVAGLDKTE